MELLPRLQPHETFEQQLPESAVSFFELGVLRLVAPLLILKFPLVGVLVAQILDKYDWKLLPFQDQGDYDFYQYWDKLLDSYYLTLAMITARRWKDLLAFRVVFGLYALRMTGVLLFLLLGDQRLFLLFPNMFEGLFVFVEVHRLVTRGAPLFTSAFRASWVTAAVGSPRWVREYFIHVAQQWPWQMFLLVSPAFDVRFWQGLYLAFPIVSMAVLLFQYRRGRAAAEARSALPPQPLPRPGPESA